MARRLIDADLVYLVKETGLLKIVSELAAVITVIAIEQNRLTLAHLGIHPGVVVLLSIQFIMLF